MAPPKGETMAHRNKGFHQEQRDWLKNNPFHATGIPSFSRFVDSLSESRKKEIEARNESYLSPRFDERFKNINTMHPANSGRFSDNPKKKKK